MLEKLDRLQFSRWHYYIIVALGTTWIFDGFEVGMLSLVNSQLMNYFQKSESQIGLISSVYLMGCCTGALIFSCFAFHYGRKQLFNCTLILYALSVVSISLSYSFEMLLISRFFTGVSVGGEYTAIFAAIDELIPAYVRGRVDIILDGTWALGGIMASVIALILYQFNQSEYVWRLQLAFGVIGVIPIIFMRQSIPESPRWLLFKKRTQDCKDVVNFIEYNCNNKMISYEKFAEIQKSSESQKQTKYTQDNQDQIKFTEFLSTIVFILFKKYPKRLVLGMVLMSVQAFFYQGIYYTFSLQLKNYYNATQNEIYVLMMPLTTAGFLGTIIFGRYFDTLGRRQMIQLTYTISGLILLIIGFLIIFVQLNKYVYVSLFFVLFLFASPGGSAAHLTVSEIFPSEMRSQAMAIFFATGLGVGGVISPYFFSKLIQTNNPESFAQGCFLAAILMIFGGKLGGVWGVDAENLPLEQISSFDRENHRSDQYKRGNYVQDEDQDDEKV